MRISFFLLIMVFLFSACQTKPEKKQNLKDKKSETSAIQEKQSITSAHFVHDYSDLKPDPNIHYGVLKNGMRYAIMHNETPKETVNFRLAFNTGAYNEKEDQNGLAHFLEHMNFNGSKKYPEGEMTKALERLGLSFGAHSNAYTNTYETVYLLSSPDVSEENINLVLDILRETTEFLTLDENAIDRERSVVLSEYSRINPVNEDKYKTKMKLFLPNTLMEKRMVIGDPEILKTATREKFLDYYHKYYTPKRAFLTIVGDINIKEIEEKVQTLFSGWEAKTGEHEDQDRGMPDIQDQVNAYNFSHKNVDDGITLGYIKPFQKQIDTRAQRKKDRLFEIGLSILRKRLTRLSRQDNSPLVDISAWQDKTKNKIANLIQIWVRFNKDDQWKTSLNQVEQELRKLIEYGILESELKEILADDRTWYKSNVEGQKTRNNNTLVSEITYCFLSDCVYTSPKEDFDIFEEFANSVTVEKVNQAIKSEMESIKPQIFVVTKKPIQGGENAILEAYHQSLKTEIKPQEDKKLEQFAYQNFGTESKIANKTYITDMDFYQIRFENGILLNVKKTEFKKGFVSVRVLVGKGKLSMPKTQPGLNILANLSLIKGGLGKHNYEDIKRITAGHYVNPAFYVYDSYTSMDHITTPNDLKFQLQLFAAYLTDPAFNQKSYSEFIKWIEAERGGIDKNPLYLAFSYYSTLLFSKDSRMHFPDAENLKKRNLVELKTWFDKEIKTAPIEISIVGDVKIDQAIKSVASSFGSLPKRDLPSRIIQNEIPKRIISSKDKHIYHKGAKTNAFYLGVYPVDPELYNTPQKQKVANILSQILSNKMIDFVREKKGSYVANSSSKVNLDIPEASSIIGYFNLKPEQIEEFKNYIHDLTEEIKAGNISEDEIKRAKEPIIKDISAHRQNNQYWLNQISRSQTYPERLNQDREYKKEKYNQVTKAELIDLAQKIFIPENYLTIITEPDQKTVQSD